MEKRRAWRKLHSVETAWNRRETREELENPARLTRWRPRSSSLLSPHCNLQTTVATFVVLLLRLQTLISDTKLYNHAKVCGPLLQGMAVTVVCVLCVCGRVCGCGSISCQLIMGLTHSVARSEDTRRGNRLQRSSLMSFVPGTLIASFTCSRYTGHEELYLRQTCFS